LLSSKVPKGSNRLKIALRNSANAIGDLKESTQLIDFFTVLILGKDVHLLQVKLPEN
jgi:hypothetical protein